MSTRATVTDALPASARNTENFTSDGLNRTQTLLGIAAAMLGGGGLTLVAWLVLRMTSWPAFNRSNMIFALSTAVTLAVLIAVGVVMTAWLLDDQRASRRRKALYLQAVDNAEPEPGEDGNVAPTPVPPLAIRRPRWRVILTYVVAYLSPAAIVISTTAIPLASTRLYLDGIQVDQGFRTQFLTRMATTWGNEDMNYADLPSYYPLGWFWPAGRLANLLGIPGWEVYQPWALITIAATACVLVPVWQRISGSLAVATAIALVSVCVSLVMSPEEPYGAVVAMGAPAATILAKRALLGSWFASVGLMIYMGISATVYTLFTGVVGVSIVAIAAMFMALHSRTWVPVKHLFLIGGGAILIALIAWGPYLWMVVTGHPHDGSAAPNYLPLEGAQIPLPFLTPSIIGVLCLLGLIFLIVRSWDPDVRSMGVSLIGFYVWAAASMVATLAGSTLLGFRIDILIVLVLATAGVLAIVEFRLVGLDRFYPNRFSDKARRYITIILTVVLAAAGLSYAQSIPLKNMTAIDNAYSNTDGYGERADLAAPDAGRYYADIDAEIRSHGYVPEDTVVFTDEINFMAFNPYLGFQAFTSHYANPLGEFEARNAAIESWADGSWDQLSDPDAFAAALDEVKWRSPDVFILRGELDDPEAGWKTHVSEDIYPNNPNVRYRGLQFNSAPFLDDPEMWDVAQIGPFVVASRLSQ